MIKIKTAYALTLLATLLPASANLVAQDKVVAQDKNGHYKLEQVLVMSRHGIRAPLVNYGDMLSSATPDKWPEWSTPGGYLTPKGAELEAMMGGYFRQWLAETKLLKSTGCPTPTTVFTYANSLPRTIDTAQHFLFGAFPGCNVPVTHQKEIGKMDPVFNPIITLDVTPEFKEKALASINQHAGPGGVEGLNKRLQPNYDLLSNILDYKNSPACLVDKKCDWSMQPTEIVLVQNKEPGITGPLKLGTGASDAFMLQYYEGFPAKDVAWGRIQSSEEWRKLIDIKNLYHETLFGSPAIADNAAEKLVGFISSALDPQGEKTPNELAAQKAKFAVLVGHDSNIASLLAALKTKEYQLPDQYERTPISGKVVFERWKDIKQNKDLMKIEYIYLSTEQIRHKTPLSLQAPPKRVTLEIEGCPIDAKGFCSMDDFRKAVKQNTQI
ncbi:MULTISPECIES: bifunctional glucose-1-phosphatase/inositol phosphatase [Yersinia]|uniref:bifunctional glucose-1-phosphatase/inositol phosphatase n=1 Tax=Yersinia TaxID=629 RepID=UPI0005DB1400|nr:MULTISPECIES: bifunctional glucose-1-phosphatase/inositol phosphatase [Yersinia]OVZ98869.1 bifunctional glucose-1-phosphatase/inositol phosphatase [Yersinia frederiksenii]RXA98494.1 bifunctional glucose-1-phosphatase/inositol phosphatase [Yersinia sp. 2105 StPb PI]CNH78916.1 glucose-1-phosphatase/inositol phosphatase [Yersinia frederiksenii]CNI65512.1 glucose-1-phosphatase/inositol phosphatase [Yersinia frederiksenii]